MKFLPSFFLIPLLVSSYRISSGINVPDTKCESGYHISGTYDSDRAAPYCLSPNTTARCNECRAVIEEVGEIVGPECRIASQVVTTAICNFLCK